MPEVFIGTDGVGVHEGAGELDGGRCYVFSKDVNTDALESKLQSYVEEKG